MVTDGLTKEILSHPIRTHRRGLGGWIGQMLARGLGVAACGVENVLLLLNSCPLAVGI